MDSKFLERIQQMKLTVDEDEAMTVCPVPRRDSGGVLIKSYRTVSFYQVHQP